MINNDKIQNAFVWYRDAMRSVAHRKVSWPEAKDYRKTYLHMWLSRFVSWSERNKLDDETMCQVIYALVRYGKRNKILFKGSAILQHERIYNIALNELESHVGEIDSVIFSIQTAEDEINKRRGNLSKHEYLLKKPGIGEFPNLVALYQAGILSKLYLAVSKTCRRVINKLNDDMRLLIPKNIELLKSQNKIALDKDKSIAIINILRDDYLK